MIPRIIHQVWFKFGDGPSNPPPEYDSFRNTWKKLHPGWEFKLWNEENTNKFLKEHYPYALELFKKYTKPIMRVDAIRYFVLHHFGGFYVDMDTEPNSSLENLRVFDVVLVKDLNPLLGINNGFMGSIPGHELLGRCVKHLPDNINSIYKDNPIMMTGPLFLTKMWMGQKSTKNILVLKYSKLKTYLNHYHYATWTAISKIRKIMDPKRKEFVTNDDYPKIIQNVMKIFNH